MNQENQGEDMARKKSVKKTAAKSKVKSKAKAKASVKQTARRRAAAKREISAYDHKEEERLNNPPVGLVSPQTDKDTQRKTYAYDPHIDPSLQWAGKAEHTAFEVPTVSLHVHERIEPQVMIDHVRKGNGDKAQMNFFGGWSDDARPLRQAVEFYQHQDNWTNRLIAGDSLLVMNSLLEKEAMAGQVQMVYIDPPYGITYGSNFQPFVNKRDVKDGNDEDLTQEPEMIKAFRDTWELGIHSYLTYMRDRLLLARELLHESGSCFVQISDENVHHVRGIMDEVFGAENFAALINFRKKGMPFGTKLLEQMCDYIIWYAKDKKKIKYRELFVEANVEGNSDYKWYESPDGSQNSMQLKEINNHKILPNNSRVYRLLPLDPSGVNPSGRFDYEFEGKTFRHPPQGYGTSKEGMDILKAFKRLQVKGNQLNYKYFVDDYPVNKLLANWGDTVGAKRKNYVVQTNEDVMKRCILMTSDPGDIVFDPTCGGGTTAFVAERWGRRWITCDTSRVATTLAKQRLMTGYFNFFELAHPDEGVGSGFKYKTVPHITMKSIIHNEPAAEETLYDQPLIDKGKARVTGPFTVEAVPAPMVKAIDEIEIPDGAPPPPADDSITRSGETLRQTEWQDELLKTGIRAKGGQHIEFSSVETLGACRYLHADAETKEDTPQRAVISFGPDHAPLEQRQVEMALEEARALMPKPKLVIFAAFQFDPEAAKDIDETKWPGITLLKAHMNGDLLTDDLKKKRSSNQSFWLIGQPDIKLRKAEGKQWQVEVRGFDYFNPKSGELDSGDADHIAMWMLDEDYDGRSLFPQQVFFPMRDEKHDWTRLAKNLKAEIDEELIEAYRGTLSLPFAAGEHKRVAVKIIDDRGIESLRILDLE